MHSRLTRLLAGFALCALCSCSDNGSTADDGGTAADGAAATDVLNAADAQHDATPAPDQGTTTAPGLGAACTCTGTDCAQAGVPKPAGGTITGCEEVPTGTTGAALVCLRTYDGELATKTYFANGYCGLMALKCAGAEMICSSAVFGAYDTMTTCPAGSVLINDTQNLNIFGQEATINTRVCAKSCAAGGDCRSAETDPLLSNTATQYQCIDKGGVKFCYDPRNLTDAYTATAF